MCSPRIAPNDTSTAPSGATPTAWAAATAGVDVLVTVGPRAAIMLNAFDGESYAVGSAQEAAALAADLIAPGDVLLVKGSRGVGLEVVAEALAGEAGG